MSVQVLKRQQVLPMNLAQAWAFFSSPHNLKTITPPELNFCITNDAPETIYPGLMITYTVSPLWGIPLPWVTEITHVESERYFVDEQRSGPYRLWHHEHHFEAVAEGVKITDLVHYDVGWGPLGSLITALVVRRRVEGIFAYREKILRERFAVSLPGF